MVNHAADDFQKQKTIKQNTKRGRILVGEKPNKCIWKFCD